MQGGCEHEESPAHPDSACAVAVEAALAGGLREPKLMHVCVRARADSPAAGTPNPQLLSSARDPDTAHFTSSILPLGLYTE